MKNIETLYKYLPDENLNTWDLLEQDFLGNYKDEMAKTPQEFKWHEEGDVLTHTKMVVENLIKLEEYQNLEKIKKLQLLLATLFHDIGKPQCTEIIDGEIRSFHHGNVGSKITRKILWQKFKLAGIKEYQNFRETICTLIKYHSRPLYITTDSESDKKRMIKLSMNQQLIPDFNIEMLYILSKADVLGRISIDKDEQLEKLETFKNIAINLNCYKKAFEFKTDYTKYAYFTKENIWEHLSLYDDTWGEIIILSGLPGTGKDTYIKNNLQNLPVISLDDIRKKLKIKPTDNQGEVINQANQAARSYLAKKQPFIWNATNIKESLRQKIINMIHNYNAKVKIIYLETSWENLIERNENRSDEVMIDVIEKMLSNITIPENFEAEKVEWICI